MFKIHPKAENPTTRQNRHQLPRQHDDQQLISGFEGIDLAKQQRLQSNERMVSESPIRSDLTSQKYISSQLGSSSVPYHIAFTNKSENSTPEYCDKVATQFMNIYEKGDSQAKRLDVLAQTDLHEVAKSQTGSKFLQKILETANPQIIDSLVQLMLDKISDTMMDHYGNYFCQKLIESISADQRFEILKHIKKDIIRICKDKRGTHAIQKFIDLAIMEEEEEYFKGVLQRHVVTLSQDPQGAHVIQKVLCSLQEEKRQFIFDELKPLVVDLAMNNVSLAVIKVLIQKTQSEQRRYHLLEEIVPNANKLAQNPYGNYALQQIFEHWDYESCQKIIPQFFGKIYQLSMQKCSSNVVDRSIQRAKTDYLHIIVQELIKCDKIQNLILNAYGNFVLQNALKYSQGEDRMLLSAQIEKVLPNLADPKIKSKWITLLKSLTTSGEGGHPPGGTRPYFGQPVKSSYKQPRPAVRDQRSDSQSSSDNNRGGAGQVKVQYQQKQNSSIHYEGRNNDPRFPLPYQPPFGGYGQHPRHPMAHPFKQEGEQQPPSIYYYPPQHQPYQPPYQPAPYQEQHQYDPSIHTTTFSSTQNVYPQFRPTYHPQQQMMPSQQQYQQPSPSALYDPLMPHYFKGQQDKPNQ